MEFPEELSIIRNNDKLIKLIDFCQGLYDVNKIMEGEIKC